MNKQNENATNKSAQQKVAVSEERPITKYFIGEEIKNIDPLTLENMIDCMDNCDYSCARDMLRDAMLVERFGQELDDKVKVLSDDELAELPMQIRNFVSNLAFEYARARTFLSRNIRRLDIVVDEVRKETEKEVKEEYGIE